MPSNNKYSFEKHFSLKGKVAVVTGGSGVLGSTVCRALARHGAEIAILDIRKDAGQAVADEIRADGGVASAYQADVLDKSQVESVSDSIVKDFGKIDLLLNFAGGNFKDATVSESIPFFDIKKEALDKVISLNLQGTILSCQAFGRFMASQKKGVILNVSSMSAIRPLTRVVGYSAAKAAISNLTQWLAVHMAQEYSTNIRVNAIAPGFFMGEQNRDLLVNGNNGELTRRGETVISQTPMRRFGKPEDLLGTVLWLLSPASAFVTGIVVPVDGGFSAYSGV